MLMFAGLLGMVAVGAAAFVGFQPVTEDSETETGESEEVHDGPDLIDSIFGPDTPEPPQGSGEIISGTPGAEDITGTEEGDQINGLDADDTISGGAGDDSLLGGLGDDRVSGETGDDTLHGGDGADTLSGGEGRDTLYGHNDADDLSGGAGDDSLVGSAGHDLLRGDAGDDAVHGDIGDDTLHGGFGRDTLFGGWGDDVIVGLVNDPATVIFDDLDSGDFLNGGSGDDLILAGQDDLVDTGEGADTVMIGDWISEGNAVEIVDFHPEEDRLIVFYNALKGNDANLSLKPGAEDTSARTLLLNGVPIATIANAEGLTLDHIALLPREALPVIRGL